jgi:xanthine dehydrogenase YagS FAD-binding subunit
MNPFNYQRATAPDEAVHAVSARGAKFLGGGTNLVDLMKSNVEQPTALIDVTHLDLTHIVTSGNATTIGAGVRNSDLANHEIIRTNYPLLSQALLSGASHNCAYGHHRRQFTPAHPLLLLHGHRFPACNKRTPAAVVPQSKASTATTPSSWSER